MNPFEAVSSVADLAAPFHLTGWRIRLESFEQFQATSEAIAQALSALERLTAALERCPPESIEVIQSDHYFPFTAEYLAEKCPRFSEVDREALERAVIDAKVTAPDQVAAFVRFWVRMVIMDSAEETLAWLEATPLSPADRERLECLRPQTQAVIH